MEKYLASTSFCLIIFYSFYYVALRKDYAYQRNRFYLLLSSLLAFLIPLIPLDISSSPQHLKGLLPALDLEQGWLPSTTAPSARWSYWSILRLGYVAGLFAFGIRLFLRLVAIRRLIKQGNVQYRRGYYLIYTRGKYPTFSFLHYLFWDETQELSSQEADQVLCHEQKHIWDKHSYDIVYWEVVKICFWFNPVVYLYERSLKLQHEYIADASVLRETDTPSYVRLMTKLCVKGSSLALAQAFHNSAIRQRLKALYARKSSAREHYKLLLLIPLIGGLFLAFSPATPSSFSDPAPAAEGKIDQNRFATVADGLDVFYDELKQYLTYPKEARLNGIEGKVFIAFTVEKDGRLSNLYVAKGLHPSCDRVALEAVKKAQTRWLPGKVNGTVVRQQLSLPITFSKDRSNKNPRPAWN